MLQAAEMLNSVPVNIRSPEKPRVVTLEDINRRAAHPGLLIEESENAYTGRINAAAEGIAQRFADCPIALISGPSGSGKTTTAKRIAQRLKYHGIDSAVISLDDYFLPGRPEPDKNGLIDYEKPDRVDAELLSQHLDILENGGEVTLPSYDFTDNTRHQGKTIRRSKNTLIIIEGIHTLNPIVTGQHHDRATFLYISVRTRIADSDGTLLHPSKIRLLRRLSRDKLFRGREFKDTMLNFSSVQRGESLYIMPFKKYANYHIDTFFEYEAGVYRTLLPELYAKDSPLVTENLKSYGIPGNDAADILPKFLSAAKGIPVELVPQEAMVREFTG